MNYIGYLYEYTNHIQNKKGTVKCKRVISGMKKKAKRVKRPIEKYDFSAFGKAIKAARNGKKESRKKVGDELYISDRYLANIENKGQHPSLQVFFDLITRYNISVDQILYGQENIEGITTQRRQLESLLKEISDSGLQIITATAKAVSDVEKGQE